MSKSKKAKAPAADYPIPDTIDQCDEFIREYGALLRERARIETSMNDELAAVKQQHEEAATPVAAKIERFEKGIRAFCESWRDALTKEGATKTYQFGSGEVSWRSLPPKVTLRKVEQILAICRRRFPEFIRVKEEINKEAMLEQAKRATRIPGVSIGSDGEAFDIKPFEAKLEEIAA